MHRALSAGRSPGFLAAAGCLFSISQSSQTWNRDICTNELPRLNSAGRVRWLRVSVLCCVCVCVHPSSPEIQQTGMICWWCGPGCCSDCLSSSVPSHYPSAFSHLHAFHLCGFCRQAVDIRTFALILKSIHLASCPPLLSFILPLSFHANSLPVNMIVWLSLFSSLSNLHDFVSRSSNKSWNLRFLSFFLSPIFFVEQAAGELWSASYSSSSSHQGEFKTIFCFSPPTAVASVSVFITFVWSCLYWACQLAVSYVFLYYLLLTLRALSNVTV